MFGGAYGDARMQNWPHWHRTPCPGSPQRACVETKGGNNNNNNNSEYLAYLILEIYLK